MDIVDFFFRDDVRLPKERTGDDFLEFLRTAFQNYLKRCAEVGGLSYVSAQIQSKCSTITDVCDRIEAAIETYFRGYPHAAYNELEHAVTLLGSDLLNLINPVTLGDQTKFLYRARIGTLESFRKDEIFHVPFHLRHLVATQRYSIPGLPCLYLGGSL